MLAITRYSVPMGAADPSGDGTVAYSAPVIKRHSATHLSTSLTGHGPYYSPPGDSGIVGDLSVVATASGFLKPSSEELFQVGIPLMSREKRPDDEQEPAHGPPDDRDTCLRFR